MQDTDIKYVILSGGIGGAKLVEGFYHSMDPEQLMVIANTGDDIIQYGLRICPDLDIIIYTLANIVQKGQGWGIQNDSFNCLSHLSTMYSQPSWFNLGDKDLATHIFRTDQLSQGIPLSQVTQLMCDRFNIKSTIVPMAEDYIPTKVETEMGMLHFEEYFVKYQFLPKLKKIIYGGTSNAYIPESIDKELKKCSKIIIAPSNPLLSIAPITEIPYYSNILKKYRNKVIGVSPIIQGKAVKGPTIENFKSLGLDASCIGVARYYQKLMKTFVFDESEIDFTENLEGKGADSDSLSLLNRSLKEMDIIGYAFDTVMSSLEKKKALAKFIIDIDI
jgi:LPPG:FO 2-phospho-L-lactate transferase